MSFTCQKEQVCHHDFNVPFFHCVDIDLDVLQSSIWKKNFLLYLELEQANQEYVISNIKGIADAEINLTVADALDCVNENKYSYEKIELIIDYQYKGVSNHNENRAETVENSIDQFRSEFEIDDAVCVLYFYKYPKVK